MRGIPIFPKLVAVLAAGTFLFPAIAGADPEDAASAPTAKISAPLIVTLRPSSGSGGDNQGLLAREIARQAFLLAAREQLGLGTRDIALREPGGKRAEAANRLLDVRISLHRSGESTIEVRRISGSKRTSLLKTKGKVDQSSLLDYHSLVDWCEQLSRSEFPEMLKRAGYPVAPDWKAERVLKQDTALGEEIEKQLGRMTCLSQFAAVRSLHEKIRREGESLALLGGLVRGYSNLGMLTELHWHSAHLIFKARGMLYAQRLHVASNRIPWARCHRAYAYAVCGLHAAALSDLHKAAEAVQKASETDQTHLDLPEWIALIADHCRFQNKRLADRSDHPLYGELASLLELRTVELTTTSRGSWNPDLPAVRENVKQIADRMEHCIRVHQSLGMLGDYDLSGLTYGPGWYRSVSRLTACPGNIAKLVAEMADEDDTYETAEVDRLAEARLRGQLIAALHDASDRDDTAGDKKTSDRDTHEPSLAVLAALVEDTAFLHGLEIASEYDDEFKEGDDELPDSLKDWRTSMLPLLARHHHRLYFQYLTTATRGAREVILKKIAKTLDKSAIQSIERPLLMEIRRFDAKKSNTANKLAFWHNNDGYRGMVIQMRSVSSSSRGKIAEKLYAVSPHSPLAIGSMIDYHWSHVSAKAKGWQTQYGNSLVVLGALGRRYLAEQQYAEARQSLSKYVKRAPDQWAYVSLANTYRLQGDHDRWLATLKEFLGLENSEWQKGSVRVQIARFFMSKRNYQQAILYADAAADSGSDNGMIAAAECNEYAKNWAGAERHFQSISEESRDGMKTTWLQYCMRTGYGDLLGARQMALESLDENRSSTTRIQIAALGHFYLLDNQPAKAIGWLRRANAKQVNPYDALHIALAAMQLGNTKVRDQALKDAVEKGGSFLYENHSRPEMMRIARLFQKSLATETPGTRLLQKSLATQTPGRLEQRTIDRAIHTASDREKTNIYYFIGRFLELTGDPATAHGYYQKCAAAPVLKTNRTMACLRLRERGYEPNDVAFK